MNETNNWNKENSESDTTRSSRMKTLSSLTKNEKLNVLYTHFIIMKGVICQGKCHIHTIKFLLIILTSLLLFTVM